MPVDLGSPCDAMATTIPELADCVLHEHTTRVEQMIAAEYRDACDILTAVGLQDVFPAACA